MARVLIGAAIAAVILTVFAAVDCALTEPRRTLGLPKWAWLLLILLLPVVGPALWLLVGRGLPGSRPRGPDDDPAFHRGPRPGADPAEDEEFRRFEQELVDLDSDADDDGETRR